MKKILPYIFILLIIVNLFAPFTVGLDKNNKPTVSKSEAEAAYMNLVLVQKQRTKSSISFYFTKSSLQTTDNNGMLYVVTDKPIGLAEIFNNPNATNADKRDIISKAFNYNAMVLLFKELPEQSPTKLIKFETLPIKGDSLSEKLPLQTIPGLKSNTKYYVSYTGYNGTKDDAFVDVSLNNVISTTGENDKVDDTETVISESSGGGFLPKCAWAVFNISIPGCIAQILYTGLFQPTSYLFGLAGQFFDFTFYYSINDDSYRSPFVIEGWGLVRDFVNIFFIFVLLWIAFATILNVHGFKTKDMVMNVVIIGLLINFSLFATQVIIDTSNILARVFYNSITSGDKTDAAGKPIEKLGVNNEVQLSAKIVSTVNPQKLIVKATKVGSIAKPGDRAGDGGGNSTGISNGTFILVTLLSTVVNIVGIFVFVSVGLIFVARVLGLWLAMIFVPLAFFSYTVPKMKGMAMVGWEKWWPDTLKLAFLAPIFIFFMYLIIKFLSADNFFSLKGDGGPEFIISVIFPFAFIMILMMKAKSLASSLAGDIGSGITKAAVVGGGVALAGGAMTAAMLGRQTLGGINKYVQNDSARNKDRKIGTSIANNFKNVKGIGKYTGVGYVGAVGKSFLSIGKGLNANIAAGVNKIGRERDPNTGQIIKKGFMQRQVGDVKDKAHAEHELNEAAQKVTNNKEATYKDLDEPEAKKARDMVDRDIVAKATYNGIAWDKLKADQRNDLEFTHKQAGDPNGEWSASADSFAHANGGHAAGAMVESLKSNVAMGEFIQSLRRGSYDIRELSKIKESGTLTGWGIGAMALGGMFLPIGLAIAASTSGAIKKGLKAATGGVDHGSSQKDFLKDLSQTINTALSHAKIDVKVDAGGGGDHGHAKADHGGGGHH